MAHILHGPRQGLLVMRTVRTLAILGDSMTALAVARDANRRGLDAHLVTRGVGPANRTGAARVHQLNAGDDDGRAAETLCRIARAAPAALVATSDRWLRFLMRCRPVLDAAFQTILHPPNDVLSICLDKTCFAEWCSAQGIRTPRATTGFEAACTGALGFPLVVRPAKTHGPAHHSLPKAIEVRCPRELESVRASYSAVGASPVVSESLLGGPLVQYSVGCARSARGLLSLVACKVRPAAAACSVGTYVELRPFPRAGRLAGTALDALDYFGIAEVEILYREDRDECYLIEINARPWLQYALVPASGRDFLGFLLDPEWHAGRAPLEVGVRWIDAGSDLVASIRGRGRPQAGEGGWLDYARSVLRANSYGTFDWRDPRPAVLRARETLERWWHRHNGGQAQ